MVNFNWYKNNKRQKNYQRSYCGNKLNPTEKQGKITWYFKYYSTKHFARNCSRNDVNVAIESNQVHMTIFNVDRPYWTLINNAMVSDFM